MQQWHVMYTKPNKETLVDSQLEDRGLETYFPYLRIERGYSRGIRYEPFFPHYLFFFADLSSTEAYGVQWLPGVRKLVHVGNRPATVPQAVIDALHKRLDPFAEKAISKSEWLFKPGQKVEITSGPFEGFEAIFQKGLNGRDRVQVLLQLVGTWTRTEMDANQLKAVSTNHASHL
jgi:transcription elongation factor/antiterminator RfaH